MVSIVFVILLLLWYDRRRAVYNPYDEELGHSSYYDVAYCGRDTCTEEICRILREIAGYKHLLTNYRFPGEDRAAEVLLIHESGIYVISSRDLEGSIWGNISGRYWIQSFREGWLFSCRNYFYNPFLENKKCLDIIQWLCRDMPKLPYYSMAVFGERGSLWTQGDLGENRWALPLSALSGTVADIMRHNRRFLRPEEVELVYERLTRIR